LKNKFVVLMFIISLILLFNGCSKTEIKNVVKPFANIPVISSQSIEFQNLTVTSKDRELGRKKTVTVEQDIQEIATYLMNISGTDSNTKVKLSNCDFNIDLVNYTDNNKNYLYSIGITKKQICIIKYNNGIATELDYKYQDTKVIEDLKRLYNKMKYSEVLLLSK